MQLSGESENIRQLSVSVRGSDLILEKQKLREFVGPVKWRLVSARINRPAAPGAEAKARHGNSSADRRPHLRAQQNVAETFNSTFLAF